MQGVAQEGDRPARDDNERLDARRGQQDAQGDRDGADSLGAALQRLIEGVLGVVRVGRDEALHEAPEPDLVGMRVVVPVMLVAVCHRTSLPPGAG